MTTAYIIRSVNTGKLIEAHDELGEMADEWTPAQRKAAVGYDPLNRPHAWQERTKYLNRSPQLAA